MVIRNKFIVFFKIKITMWVSKLLDIIGAIVYLLLVFLGIRLGFRKSFKVLLFVIFITVFNMVVFRIFKHFIAKGYIEVIDVGVLMVSSVVAFFIFYPLVEKIYESIGDIDIMVVNRMMGLFIFTVSGIFIIGYFVIFTDIIPTLYYILETSSFLRILSNIVKYIIGISIF